TLRILCQRNRRRAGGNGGGIPPRLAGGRAGGHRGGASHGGVLFVGALRGLLGRRSFAHATARHHIEGAARGTHDQRAAHRDRQRPAGRQRSFLVRGRQDDRRLAGIERWG